MYRLASLVCLALCSACAQPRTGVLVMAHGGDQQWNAEVEATVAPLRADHPTEIAFGMAVPSTIEAAVRKLEASGTQRIVVVRMFVSGDSFLEPTEYILGLRDSLPAEVREVQVQSKQEQVGRADGFHCDHAAMAADAPQSGSRVGSPAGGGHEHHHMEAPRRIRASARFVLSRRGVAESPLVDQILVDRVRALSRDPGSESVLILGHGPGDDAENDHWLTLMRERAGRLGEIGRFRNILCETLREDWPEKRAGTEKRIRQFVTVANRDGGHAIVVPFRVSGFGPYKEVLAGLEYVADGRGFCPHPGMTRWVREAVDEVLSSE